MTMRRLGRMLRESVRILLAIAAVMLPGVLRAPAMVGGAPPAADGAGRSVVMILGSFGTACTATAVARDLLLTAAHCVQPGADYKLVDRQPGQSLSEVPLLKDVARIERDPQFDLKRLFAHLATADVALIKLVEPLPATNPAGADRRRHRNCRGGRHARGRRLWRHRARRRPHRRTGSRRQSRRHRPAGKLANPPVRSGDQRPERRSRRLRRRFRRAGFPRPQRQTGDHRRGELVDRPESRAAAAAASPASRRWCATAAGSSTRRGSSARRSRRNGSYSTPGGARSRPDGVVKTVERNGRSSMTISATMPIEQKARRDGKDHAEGADELIRGDAHRGGDHRRRRSAALRRGAEPGQHDRTHHGDDEGARQRPEKIHRPHGDADLMVRDRVLDRHCDGRIGTAGAETDASTSPPRRPISASADRTPARRPPPRRG